LLTRPDDNLGNRSLSPYLLGYGFADLNEAEGFLWQTFEESRWASSASHLLGRPVTSSETWTWFGQVLRA